MVRALLVGSKTQTRRVCKPMNAWVDQDCREVRNLSGVPHHYIKGAKLAIERLRSPYGQVGDQLWVRETFLIADERAAGRPPWVYAADYADRDRPKIRWKPSIHMPRAASRLTLEITSVRVERLQDISEVDALAEGVEPLSDPGAVFAPAKSAYCDLWESINGSGSWDLNPWVWVIEFKKVKP